MQTRYPHINSGVYVLELEGGKFYVGCSRDIHQRLSSHNSRWTNKHSPKRVDDIFPAHGDIKQLEKEVTLMYMREYGWENVRGGPWTKVDMRNPPRALRSAAK